MKAVVSKIDAWMQSNIILWLMVIAGAVVHGILCFGQTIWLDEALTGSFIRMGWLELLQFTTTDVHPPLYYFIVKLGITIFGDHLYVIKLFSFLPFLLMLLLTVTKVKRRYGEKVTFVLLALFCITPCIIERNAEMRMYQWAMFFVFAFAIYLFEAIVEDNTKNWFICLLAGLCAAYTHYYALITVAILYAIVFFVKIKKRSVRIGILRNAAVSVIGYLPWVIVFLNQAKTLKETGWWQESGLSPVQIYEYIVWPFQDNTGYAPFLFLIMLAAVLLCAIRNQKDEHRLMTLSCIGGYFALILVGIGILLFYQPVFITRFLYPAVGILLFGLAIGVAKWRSWIILLISVFLLFFGAKTYNSQLHYQFSEESVPRLRNFMESVEETDLIICDQDAVKCIVEYLFPDYEIKNDVDVDPTDISGRDVYYFVCDKKSCEENKLESLGVQGFEYRDEIYFLYHGFEIYSVQKER